MKITEVCDVQNCDNNLIIGQNTYVLINDYENYKNRLHDHSSTLESLTQQALNLSLFKSLPQNLKKPSYQIKNEKLKELQKRKIQGLANGELLVIKKLLLINLRSFKVMQRLFQENKELQKLLKNSHTFVKKQRQEIQYMKNENKTLKKTELHVKKRFESFFRQLNRLSKSFMAGLKNDHHDHRNNRVSSNESGNENKKLELALNLSTNISYRLSNTNKSENEKLAYSSDLDIFLQDLKIHSNQRNSSNRVLKINYSYVDAETRYFILMRQVEKFFESYSGNSKSIEVLNKNTAISNSQISILDSDSESNECTTDDCYDNDEKDVRKALTLHCVNSSIWNSFLAMKTVQEVVIFYQICELIKVFLVTRKICENSEMNPEGNLITLFQLENSNPHLVASEFTNEYVGQNSVTIMDKIADVNTNEKKDEQPKKRYPKIKVFYSLKRIHTKFVNNSIPNNKLSRKRISEKQAASVRKNISIGVGDSYTVLVDQECQVDKDIFVKPDFEPEYSANERVNVENKFFYKTESGPKTHRPDFKKSLKSLEKIIKSCQMKSEQESTTTLKDKLRRNRLSALEKHSKSQHKVDNKIKEVKQKNRKQFDFYQKENRKISELPEMSRRYQITLENKMPSGISFEYSNPDKSKTQLLFLSNSRDTRRL